MEQTANLVVEPSADLLQQVTLMHLAKEACLGVGLVKFATLKTETDPINWIFGRYVHREINKQSAHAMANAFIEGQCTSRSNPVRIMVKEGEVVNADGLLKDEYSGLELTIPEIEFASGVKDVVVLAGHHRYVAANKAFGVVFQAVMKAEAELQSVQKRLSEMKTEDWSGTDEGAKELATAQFEMALESATITHQRAMKLAHLVQMWPAEVYSFGG